MRPCPICKVKIDRHKFMCLMHWRMVPASLQTAIQTAWDRYRHALRHKDHARALTHGNELRFAQEQAIEDVKRLIEQQRGAA